MNSPPSRCGSKTMPWVPRLWYGMTVSAWLSLLKANRFAVSPARMPRVVGVSLVAMANSLLAATQTLLWKRRLERRPLPDNPIFVVGHWRSGTTLVHELLSLDPRHTYPDTYACLAPSHFLVSRYLVPWWLQLLMPRRRPMDNVRVGWKQPQEDEWALCLLGVPTPYRTIAFPRRLPQCPQHLSLEGLSEAALAQWDTTLRNFLKSVLAGRETARLVLKSPTHTARIAHLHQLFPQARFVHVVRDPLTVFPSSVRLWKRLAYDHGLQPPCEQQLESFVLDTFVEMYEAFERQRNAIPAEHICDVHYEQLVADPVGQLRRVYERLQLGDFEDAYPHLQQHMAGIANYRVNRYEVSAEQRKRVLSQWSDFCQRYGYAPDQKPRRRQAA